DDYILIKGKIGKPMILFPTAVSQRALKNGSLGTFAQNCRGIYSIGIYKPPSEFGHHKSAKRTLYLYKTPTQKKKRTSSSPKSFTSCTPSIDVPRYLAPPSS